MLFKFRIIYRGCLVNALTVTLILWSSSDCGLLDQFSILPLLLNFLNDPNLMKWGGPSFITRKTKKSIDYFKHCLSVWNVLVGCFVLNNSKKMSWVIKKFILMRNIQQSRGFYIRDARVVTQQDYFSLINRVEYKVPTRQIKHLHGITIFLLAGLACMA